MAELNLKQIIDRLNTEFTGETRKLVFWYDDKAEFEEDIDSVELDNAKVYKLEKDNQFYTKYFLEREDTTTNYLIYAPFPKVSYIDKRKQNGALWILGGSELQSVVNKAKKLGFTFIYKEGGGKVTKGKNAWWCKK